MAKASWPKMNQSIKKFFSESITQYTIIFTFIICFFVVMEAIFEILRKYGIAVPEFISQADQQLIIEFVGWFGIIYSVVWSAVLVREWEHFDELYNTFDREADAIKTLMIDLLLLQSQYDELIVGVLESLQKYSQNVLSFIAREITLADEVKVGNERLMEIRRLYQHIFRKTPNNTSDALIEELLTQLNTIIDNRGDRISLSKQKWFGSFKSLTLITSIIWLLPFYFLYFQDPTDSHFLNFGIFGWLLIITLTVIVVISLAIVDDLDRPFDGLWMIDKESWENLVSEINKELSDLKIKKSPSMTDLHEKSIIFNQDYRNYFFIAGATIFLLFIRQKRHLLSLSKHSN